MVKNTCTLPNLEYKTDEQLNYFDINENDILSIIKSLNASTAQGWHKTSVRMTKICGITIAIPLKLVFRSIIEEGVFSHDREKSYVVPMYKRDSKNLIKN